MDARLREWTHRLGLHVHLLDRTSELGAILVAGPRARELLQPLADDPLDAASLPHAAHREVEVAGIPCTAIRTGFVGELGFELHHPRSRGPALWSALMGAGEPVDIRPFGLDALEILRLEKGHLYIGQDALPDDTPAKLGLDRAVDMTKDWFVGKAALERLAAIPLGRRLTGLAIDGGPPDGSELRGMPVMVGDDPVGRVTSAASSPALGRSIGLAWVRAFDGQIPAEGLRVGDAVATVAPTPFYDPGGERLRG
jgi:glycine cleavage system aminomethyltransferase T